MVTSPAWMSAADMRRRWNISNDLGPNTKPKYLLEMGEDDLEECRYQV